jgi:hypothetical protein
MMRRSHSSYSERRTCGLSSTKNPRAAWCRSERLPDKQRRGLARAGTPTFARHQKIFRQATDER